MTRGLPAVLTGMARAVRSRLLARRGWLGVAASAVTLVATLAVVDRAPDDAAAAGPVTFRELVQGSRGFELPGEPAGASGRVLRSPSQATALLRSWGIEDAQAKSVNFARESLIVVLAAYQPTGGYRAGVARVVVRGRQATVTARVRYEGAETAGQSTTRPWVIVAVKRTPVARVRTTVRLDLR